eukprot:7106105-Pyramimonas_sp.AAC.1
MRRRAIESEERSAGLPPTGARPEPRPIPLASALCDGGLGDASGVAGRGLLPRADVQDPPPPYRVPDDGSWAAGPVGGG